MSTGFAYFSGFVTLPVAWALWSWVKALTDPHWHRVFGHETGHRILHEHHYAVSRWFNATPLMRWHFRHIGQPLCRRNQRLRRGEWDYLPDPSLQEQQK